ncbi:hypothetical protein FGO68_gene9947 [Halteria grandinella]|uniref:Uncharacterized protein n=1 Tax=Halteria grandinella TaxID=5974 RepID=A0A8J8NUW2_HALGN|nr:hypothetical protein FGO68_gene9947 [Halteria grandinella]
MRNTIADYQRLIDQNQVKQTLKSESTNVAPIPSLFTMPLKKTILNKDGNASHSGKKASSQGGEGGAHSEPTVPINCVAFNQNEKYADQFATVDEQGRLSIWDAKKGVKQIEEPKVTNGLLMTCSFESREGKLIACGGIDTKLHIFSINPSGKKKEKLTLIEKVKELTGHYGLITCSSFMNQQYLVSGSNDSSIMLWDLEKPGRFLVKYGEHQNEVLSLDVFQLDGNIIVSGSNDATTRVWDIRQKSPCIRIFEKNKCGVSAVKFMTDCVNTIAIGCDDSSIKLYDLRAIGKIGKYKEEQGFESVQSLAFSTSGRLLFSSYNNNNIKVWDVLQERKVTQIKGQHREAVKSISMSYDGGTLVSAGKDGIVHLWGQ